MKAIKDYHIIEKLKGYARKLFRDRKEEYVIRAMNYKEGDRYFFNTDEYEVLSYEILGMGNKNKIMEELNFGTEEYEKFKEECLHKLEFKIMDLIFKDLRQSIYRPKDYERRLKKIFGENYPLKNQCDKLLVQVSRFNRPTDEITRAKEVQQIAEWYDLPWIYIREQKYNELWGISKSSPKWVREWYKEIDAEENEKSPVTLVMPKRLARVLLNALSNAIEGRRA